MLQGRAGVRISEVVGMNALCLPRLRDDLGLVERGTELTDGGGLDLALWHAADGVGSCSMFLTVWLTW